MNEAEELAEIRRIFSSAPSWYLRMTLVIGWVLVRVRPARRRDQGLAQRLNLFREFLRERRS